MGKSRFRAESRFYYGKEPKFRSTLPNRVKLPWYGISDLIFPLFDNSTRLFEITSRPSWGIRYLYFMMHQHVNFWMCSGDFECDHESSEGDRDHRGQDQHCEREVQTSGHKGICPLFCHCISGWDWPYVPVLSQVLQQRKPSTHRDYQDLFSFAPPPVFFVTPSYKLCVVIQNVTM